MTLTPSSHNEFYIGLMSGTSLDGVDGALCEFTADGRWQGVIAHGWRPFEPSLRNTLWALQSSGPDELHRLALAGNGLARVCAQVCDDLRAQVTLPRGNVVRAIGAHGQTVRHQPGLHDGIGYTWQLLQPAVLAELSGIDVVADLRSADVAAIGQGAPLVPPFHRAVFGADHPRVVVNIGGISNITILRPDESPKGFDCGPGNALMDHWVHRHHGKDFDRNGEWAAAGQPHAELLSRWLSEPYFKQSPPKSTGRDLFNPDWLARTMTDAPDLRPVDAQATLCELTARTIVDAVKDHAPDSRDVLVCGGGAFNAQLMSRIAAGLPGIDVRATDSCGLPAMQVEAAAFAWLARMFMHRQPANEPAVTGARRYKVLGALYPA